MKNLKIKEVINRGETELKKTEGKKRKSPCTPYREKGKGKEIKPGFMNESISPRACARSEAVKKVERRGGGGQRRLASSNSELYSIAGAAADELIRILNPSDRSGSRKLWAYYCYHHDPEIIIDKAYECASCARQGELRSAVAAFQHWLSNSFREGGAR